jgi:hypothetical protein
MGLLKTLIDDDYPSIVNLRIIDFNALGSSLYTRGILMKYLSHQTYHCISTLVRVNTALVPLHSYPPNTLILSKYRNIFLFSYNPIFSSTSISIQNLLSDFVTFFESKLFNYNQFVFYHFYYLWKMIPIRRDWQIIVSYS